MKLQNITVYCGSNLGAIPQYHDSAIALGKLIATQGRRLIYGGGNIGMMGTVADSVLAHGGEVIGVIPTFLRQKEKAHDRLTQLIETPDMTTRKAKLIELGDGFIVMAGGLGTYEEVFEVLSAKQLSLTQKPIGFLNTAGFFDPLLALLKHTADMGFMPQADLGLICVSDDPATLLNMMENHQHSEAVKWIEPDWYKN